MRQHKVSRTLLALAIIALATQINCAKKGCIGSHSYSPVKVEPGVWAVIGTNCPTSEQSVAESDLHIYFTLVNDTKESIHPEIDESHLLINGIEPASWKMNINNGIRDSRWSGLPSGDYLSFAYKLGRYFRRPGVYHVEWHGNRFRALPLVIRVLPNKTP